MSVDVLLLLVIDALGKVYLDDLDHLHDLNDDLEVLMLFLVVSDSFSVSVGINDGVVVELLGGCRR